MTDYYAALICENGHVIDSTVDGGRRWRTRRVDAFCGQCGAKTIDECPACSTWIRGAAVRLTARGGNDLTGGRLPEIRTEPFERSNYCYQCGEPYPWTSTAFDQARLLAESAALDADDIVAGLHAVASDESPAARAAITRLKDALTTAPAKVSRDIYGIAVFVARAWARDLVGPS